MMCTRCCSTHTSTSVCLVFLSAGLLAQTQPHRPVLIEAGRVLHVRAGAYLNHQGILVEDERIQEVGDFSTVQSHAPKDVVAIDLQKATVLPGLIDCHAH